LFELDPRFQVVFETSLVTPLGLCFDEIDVVVMDPVNGTEFPLERLGYVLDAAPDTAIVVVTDHQDESFLANAVRSNIRGFLRKSETSGAAILDAVYLASSKRVTVVDSQLIGGLINVDSAKAALGSTQDLAFKFTVRELEVLRLLAKGISDTEIASLLGIATTTVQTHISNTMHKAHANTRVQLGAIAHAANLIDGPSQIKPLEAAV
jgi:DNA-binding NarL/FixJ family response regulator